ncbi:MAG: phosphoadenosine phosphosulfate reductase family protein, partial [Pseudomonadota bacterium]
MSGVQTGGEDRLVSLPAQTLARALTRLAEGLSPQQILALSQDIFAGRLAMVSSFGAESAALLHMTAEIDRDMPVLFLETGMLFSATLDYQRDLAARLGLQDVRLIRPDAAALEAEDAQGSLHATDPDACCSLRKTRPLEHALAPFSAWIT